MCIRDSIPSFPPPSLLPSSPYSASPSLEHPDAPTCSLVDPFAWTVQDDGGRARRARRRDCRQPRRAMGSASRWVSHAISRRQNTSEHTRTHQNTSERIRTHQNASEHVRTHQNTSEHVRTRHNTSVRPAPRNVVSRHCIALCGGARLRTAREKESMKA
eukprot:3096299-Rhodomonas_salina.2